MADVAPFRGLRYDQQMVGDLSPIVCPPFDTIPPELQRTLYERSPYNVVRLEAGETLPTDTPNDNRYTRAASLLASWINTGVFLRDTSPAFYLVEHTFQHRGTGLSRLELMCRVRLEEYERRVVLPHEYTRAADKRDRLALMEACHVNLSPIMCLYRDRQGRLNQVFRSTMTSRPLVEFSDAGEQGYRLWRIDTEGDVAEIGEVMSSKSLYIADGHHRYETALAFRDRAAADREGSDEPSNFVMMGLISFDDPGLLVLPYDRVLRGLDSTTLKKVGERLHQFFDVEPLSTREGARLDAFLTEIDLRGKAGPAMGLLDPQGVDGAEGEVLQLLTLKNDIRLESWGPIAESEAWILEEQVLRPILGDALAQCLEYIHEGEEAAKLVRTGEYQLGFFLRSFPLDLFERIMDQGQRLPPKSTFFYPKLPTGVVINVLEGNA